MVIQSFTMLFLGGIGTTWGPVIGALMVLMLPEFLRGLKELQDVVYSIVLVSILIFLPQGPRRPGRPRQQPARPRPRKAE